MALNFGKLLNGLFGDNELLKSEEDFLAVVAADWHVTLWDADGDCYLGRVVARVDGVSFVAPVHLPHGAIVTKVIVYGNLAAQAETWTLSRVLYTSNDRVTMATAAFNTADIVIAYARIDNDNYNYGLESSSLDIDDEIYGCKIFYTLGE